MKNIDDNVDTKRNLPNQNDNNTERLIAHIDQLTARIQRLELNIERLRERSDTSNITSTDSITDNNHSALSRSLKSKRIVKDCNNTIIEVGDRVEFLTSGKYSSTEGIVKTIGKTFVFAIDSDKRSIARAPHNLKIVEKHRR